MIRAWVLIFSQGLNVPPIITHIYATITLSTLVTNEVKLSFDVRTYLLASACEPLINVPIRSTIL